MPTERTDAHLDHTSGVVCRTAILVASGAEDYQRVVGGNVVDRIASGGNTLQAQVRSLAPPCHSSPYRSPYSIEVAGTHTIAGVVAAGAVGAARMVTARRFLGSVARILPRKEVNWSAVAAACCPYRSTSASPVQRRVPLKTRNVRERERDSVVTLYFVIP